MGIFIADSPVTEDGRFPEGHVIDNDVMTFETRRWSPFHPLYVGHYWWNVWSINPDNPDESFFSSPTDFTIPVALRLYGIR